MKASTKILIGLVIFFLLIVVLVGITLCKESTAMKTFCKEYNYDNYMQKDGIYCYSIEGNIVHSREIICFNNKGFMDIKCGFAGE